MTQLSIRNYPTSRSYVHSKILAVLIIVIGSAWTSEGLRLCYHCNTTTGGLDCVHNPSNVTDGEISCKGYCTILRKDYVYFPEDASLVSIRRTCEDKPRFLDTVMVEGYFKIYYRSCQNYLCNGGTGVQSLRDIPIDPAWDLYPDDEVESNQGWSTLASWQNPWIHLFFLLLIFSVI